jgi:guanylate kinase
MPNKGRGLLFIVSAPSGAGKTTLVERLVEQTPHLKMSRSYTSRHAREGETDGVDYNFVTRERFEAMVSVGEFLEWADVFGNLYGTSAADTERVLASGCDLVLVIDVQGARKVRRRGIETTAVFVMPPSMEVLERRLRGRSKDSEHAIQRRLAVARQEVVDHHVVIGRHRIDLTACGLQPPQHRGLRIFAAFSQPLLQHFE